MYYSKAPYLVQMPDLIDQKPSQYNSVKVQFNFIRQEAGLSQRVSYGVRGGIIWSYLC